MQRTQIGWIAAAALLATTVAAGCRSSWSDGLQAERGASVARLLHRRDGAAPDAAARPAGGALADYVAFALARNAGLRSAAARWEAARHRVAPAASLPDPQLQYTGFLEPIETRTGPQRNRVALMQKLPWPGKLLGRGDVAAAEAGVRWWAVEGSRRAVAREVARHWYEIAFLARATAIMRDHLQILQRLEPVVQRRIQTGGRQDDLVRLQVEIGRVTDDVARLESNRPALAAQLAAVCDYRGTTPLPAPVLEVPAIAVPAIARLLAALPEGSPQLAGLRERIRKAEHQQALAELAPIPDLTVGAMWAETGPARIPNQRDSGDDPFAITLGVNVPIWIGKYSGGMRAAAAERSAAESALQDAENGLRATVHLQRFRLEDAARQIALYRDTLLPRAEQALTLVETAYRSAKSDLLSVIDSERMLLNFRRAYWRAVADYGRAWTEIEALVGPEVR
ncbi:MAG: TolC family protein [Planctomycetota bacterium]|jgi:outer membrane protein TolC